MPLSDLQKQKILLQHWLDNSCTLVIMKFNNNTNIHVCMSESIRTNTNKTTYWHNTLYAFPVYWIERSVCMHRHIFPCQTEKWILCCTKTKGFFLLSTYLQNSPDHVPAASSSCWASCSLNWSSTPPPGSVCASFHLWLCIWAFLSSSQARLEHSRHSVFPVPVGLSKIPL